MHVRQYILTILFGLSSYANAQQVIARFEVRAQSVDLETPFRADIGKLTTLSDNELTLLEILPKQKSVVPFQVERNAERTMHWLAKFSKSDELKVFELIKKKSNPKSEIRVVKDDKNFTIQSGDKNLLRYVHATTYPPTGVDSAFARSGFIHPLWSPHGQELTRIQPADHYHHYGIWNPWTHTLYKGDTVDFWNIGGKQGTVRFAKLISSVDGPVFSEIKVLHEHVVTKKRIQPEVALNETQTIRVYKASTDYYVVDFTFEMSCATENPVKLLEYRYGGLGWRTTEQWNRNNSEVLTSEGKSRKEADGTKARWCIVQGEIGNDYAGVVMLSNPTNYNHPEPLRIWPENQYNRGDMFANFSPTKNMDWLLEPGKQYTLRYRFVVFNGKFTAAQAEGAWKNFVEQHVAQK
jgi:Methane oxygenase PmoA